MGILNAPRCARGTGADRLRGFVYVGIMAIGCCIRSALAVAVLLFIRTGEIRVSHEAALLLFLIYIYINLNRAVLKKRQTKTLTHSVCGFYLKQYPIYPIMKMIVRCSPTTHSIPARTRWRKMEVHTSFVEPSLLHDHHVCHAGRRKTVSVSEGERQLRSPRSPSLGQGASSQRLPGRAQIRIHLRV